MEDLARFVLDDDRLSAELKGLRHDLRAALTEVPGVDVGLLLASRDTERDVGTLHTHPGECRREGLRDLALAASGRLCEALRCIEEASKALGGNAAAFEALRYRAYPLEQSLALALGTGTCPQWRLCILITESLCRLPWLQVARAAIAGGADCLQMREKALPDRDLLSRAAQLVDTARSHPRKAAVIVNDRADIALAAGADGVHLGQEDLPVGEARRIAGDRLWLGVSTATLEDARAAARAGADYCGVGPMFATTTKHKPVLGGPGSLRAYLEDSVASRLPHLAIGGITPHNVHELVRAGCRGVAVSSAVCGAEDPEAICRALVSAFSDDGGGSTGRTPDSTRAPA
jgi:thiamine-phosphate pyrophosphorylase